MENLIAAAKKSIKADVLLKNGYFFNCFSGQFWQSNIAIKDGKFIGWGNYEAEQEVDCYGKYITPGFCDAHVHIESSLLAPKEFIKSIIPFGTLSFVADPHEIANVCGINGIKYILNEIKDTNFNAYIVLPSCVPASEKSHSAAKLECADLMPFIDHPQVLGLGEFMNYPGVINCETDVIAKLNSFKNKKNDGHAPRLSAEDLNAYICGGIISDHECVSGKEAKEKIAKGMFVQIREGTFATNLDDLLPIIDDYTYRRCMFATDDRKIMHIKRAGHINEMVRRAVEHGIPVPQALIIACFNYSQCYGLTQCGAIAPGYKADFLVFSDLVSFVPERVYLAGKLIAEKGEYKGDDNVRQLDKSLLNTVKIQQINREIFKVRSGKSEYARIIDVVPFQAVTRQSVAQLPQEGGCLLTDIGQDIAKISVIERHSGLAHGSTGFIRGFEIKNGAIAQSISHDDHNLVILGVNDNDMAIAAQEIVNMKGGICVVCDGKILARLALQIGGLMSDKSANEVADYGEKIMQAARAIGIRNDFDTIISLGYMSLNVIPELKITSQGLFDVNKFDYSPVGL